LVDFLNFSLDGGDAETHYSSRGVKIFDRVAAMQEVLRSIKMSGTIEQNCPLLKLGAMTLKILAVKRWRL